MEHAGFTPVPNFFLHNYHALIPRMTHAEAMFVIHIVSFKWKSSAPFPSLAKIAKQMGVTPQAVRAYARSLEKKAYLRREKREGLSNLFHLNGLFSALEAMCAQSVEIEMGSEPEIETADDNVDSGDSGNAW